MVMLAFLPVQLTVNAATDDSDSVGAISESENNDDYASANSFSLNSTISGKMSSYDDADYYKITPTKNGKVELTFNNTYTVIKVALILNSTMRLSMPIRERQEHCLL